MSTTEKEELNALKAVIEGYEKEYAAATNPTERSELRQLITTTRNNLTELLRAQATAAQATTQVTATPTAAAPDARSKRLFSLPQPRYTICYYYYLLRARCL